MGGYLLVAGRAVVALQCGHQFDDSAVAEQQVRDEPHSSHPQLPVLVVDALEQPSQLLRVKALVDGLLVREVLPDESASCITYSVRLFISAMNFYSPLSACHYSLFILL